MDNTDKIKELEAKASDILRRNEHWKSCQDGSYEMALHYSGYWTIVEEIKRLKEVDINAT